MFSGDYHPSVTFRKSGRKLLSTRLNGLPPMKAQPRLFRNLGCRRILRGQFPPTNFISCFFKNIFYQRESNDYKEILDLSS